MKQEFSKTLRDDSLRYMNALLREAFENRDSDDIDFKKGLARIYAEARNNALSLGADVSSFPKRINYDKIRKKESDDERKKSAERRMGELQRRIAIADRERLDKIIERYSPIEEEANIALIYSLWGSATGYPLFRLNAIKHAFQGLAMLQEQSESLRGARP